MGKKLKRPISQKRSVWKPLLLLGGGLWGLTLLAGGNEPPSAPAAPKQSTATSSTDPKVICCPAPTQGMIHVTVPEPLIIIETPSYQYEEIQFYEFECFD